jgi:hypothetical protein
VISYSSAIDTVVNAPKQLYHTADSFFNGIFLSDVDLDSFATKLAMGGYRLTFGHHFISRFARQIGDYNSSRSFFRKE